VSVSGYDTGMRRALLQALVFIATLVMTSASHLYGQGSLRSSDRAVVFFGDSRTHHNFDMAVVERMTGLPAYNFGIDGGSTRQTVLMLDRLLDAGQRPKVIVLEADVNSLTSTFGELNPAAADGVPALVEHYRGEQTSQMLACDETQEGTVVQCAGYHGSSLFVPERPWSGATSCCVSLVLIDTVTKTLFERAIARARARGAAVLLDQTPFYLTDKIYPAVSTAPVEAFFCGLARADPHVLYARPSHLDGVDHDPSLFYDRSHFNAEGARIMSEAIAPLIAALARGERREPCVLR
jgi:lysophospholipase L1-like esterase